MKIVIPDDYQDVVGQLECFSLIRHHDVIRYREPARDLTQLVERLCDAEIVVSIRERVEFPRALLERLPKLKLIALVGRNSKAIDFAACTELGIPVATGKSNSPVAPAELALALIVASRRNVALEAERMKRGDWPCTLSHRLRGSTLGIFGLGAIGQLVAEGGPAYAAVDVCEQEPIIDGNHPFLSMPNVLCTPHLGWAEWVNFELYFREAFEQIAAYEQGLAMRLGNPGVQPRS